MKILFVGGTGLISTACSSLALQEGHDLWLLNRDRTHNVALPEGARHLHADANAPEEVRSAIKGLEFDVVVQWVAFTPDQVARDIDIYRGAGQYVFISSASVYQKPPEHYVIDEWTPVGNPYWQYSTDKIACEELLRAAFADSGFPATIVRPSHTYGPSQIPVSLGSWTKPYTVVDRMRRGKPVIVPGDGTNLWVLTHNSDFAKGFIPLLGRSETIGDSLHITSEEALSWNQIYFQIAQAAGAEAELLHISTDALVEADETYVGQLWGDKANSIVFDNSKIRRLVPGFEATVPFSEGIAQSIAWFDADEARRELDQDLNALWDDLAGICQDTRRRFRQLRAL